MSNDIALRPSYWASVSGGKDSLYMLNLILHNLDRYPLDGVVHFELEIDYPFIHDVMDYVENECKKYGVTVLRIKPRKTWEELFYKKKKNGYIYGFPKRNARWCNNQYKLDAQRQLKEMLKSKSQYAVWYIGYCVDEAKRYEKRINAKQTERYPLVENNIVEADVLEWAKEQPLFNNYYLVNKRCGCMYCPMASKISHAYLYKYYPENFKYMIDKMKETERVRLEEYGRPISLYSQFPKYDAEYLENIVKNKWLKRLNALEKQNLNIIEEKRKAREELEVMF